MQRAAQAASQFERELADLGIFYTSDQLDAFEASYDHPKDHQRKRPRRSDGGGGGSDGSEGPGPEQEQLVLIDT